MAWTAPMTAVDNTIWTSAQWNTHVRDNLNETMPGRATTAGRWFVASGANTIAEREISSATVSTSQATTSTSYTDLATVGPSVAVTTGTSAIAFYSTYVENSSANSFNAISVAVSGSTTVAASDSWRAAMDGAAANSGWRFGTFYKFTSLTAGSNTFTMKYRVGSGTGTFAYRELVVMAL